MGAELLEPVIRFSASGFLLILAGIALTELIPQSRVPTAHEAG
jgi:hypothetical protein